MTVARGKIVFLDSAKKHFCTPVFVGNAKFRKLCPTAFRILTSTPKHISSEFGEVFDRSPFNTRHVHTIRSLRARGRTSIKRRIIISMRLPRALVCRPLRLYKLCPCLSVRKNVAFSIFYDCNCDLSLRVFPSTVPGTKQLSI